MSAVWVDVAQSAASKGRADRLADNAWLAEHGATHKRCVKRLYWLMAICAAGYMLAGSIQARGADVIPHEQLSTQSRRLRELRPGEKACTYIGWVASKEGHVWLATEVVAELPCQPSVNHVLVLRTRTGWAVTVKAPVPVNGWDAEYAGKGGSWVKAERVEVVK